MIRGSPLPRLLTERGANSCNMRFSDKFSILVACLAGMVSLSQPAAGQEYRDPLKWPFSVNSIWNTPVGSDAVYVHAGIERAMSRGMTVDEDVIVMRPEARIMKIHKNYAGWDRTKSRCPAEGAVMLSAPVPHDFIVSPDTWDGLTPNSGLAVLMPDRLTIRQTQPFAHCEAGEIGTTKYDGIFSGKYLWHGILWCPRRITPVGHRGGAQAGGPATGIGPHPPCPQGEPLL